MAYCPHCNQNAFEIEEIEVGKAKLNFVQCVRCTAPVAAIDSSNVGLTEILRVLVSSLQKLNSRLDAIEQSLTERTKL